MKENKDELISKYRTELFETDDIDLEEINGLISDDDLKKIIAVNNTEMCKLINQKPLDSEYIRRLFIANVNFYKLAKYRKINIPGTSFIMSLSSVVNYDMDKLYDEFTVGRYKRVHR